MTCPDDRTRQVNIVDAQSLRLSWPSKHCVEILYTTQSIDIGLRGLFKTYMFIIWQYIIFIDFLIARVSSTRGSRVVFNF
jgi:hypothetical protein